MIGVIDYRAGNLQSVANALDRLRVPFAVCERSDQVAEAERIILPGVGHFGAAARALAETGTGEALRVAAEAGKPILGICLGMQLLLEESDEAPGVPGLGLLPGGNVRLEASRVPHMGWNRVRWGAGEDYYYFAHSYVAAPRSEHVVATTEVDGHEIPVAIGRGATVGVQFHPEKSGERGLELIEEFCRC
jgi:imidazole glycerol phosphate synthase glutamine amidotransferase subunit